MFCAKFNHFKIIHFNHLGLWFGTALIDTTAIIKLVMVNLKILLLKLINAQLIQLLRRLLNHLKRMVTLLEAYNWRKILIALTLPVICVQIYILVDNYLQFTTKTSVSMTPYLDANNTIPLRSLPAITVCYGTLFELILTDPDVRRYYTDSVLPNIRYRSSSRYDSMIKTSDNYTRDIATYYLIHNPIRELDNFDGRNKNYLDPVINGKQYERFVLNHLDVNGPQTVADNTRKFYRNISHTANAELDTYSSLVYCMLDGLRKCRTITPVVRTLAPQGLCNTYLSDSTSHNVLGQLIDHEQFNKFVQFLEIRPRFWSESKVIYPKTIICITRSF